MLSQACVILFTQGGSASVHAGIPAPLGPGTPPQDQTPPGARHTPRPGTPQDQAAPHTEHAGRYGQCAGSTHPTGMQSCFSYSFEWNRKAHICFKVTLFFQQN